MTKCWHTDKRFFPPIISKKMPIEILKDNETEW